MTTKYRIFMGYDPRERLAYEVAKHSIECRTGNDVSIEPLDLQDLRARGLYYRPTEKRGEQLWDIISDAPMSTEFAISRFLTPIIGKKGWVLFMDCDMVALTDIRELFKLADDKYAVMCVKHNHIPEEGEKFHDAGMIQTTYPRKNWSSVVLYNCDHPANQALTEEVVNTQRGLWLHGFQWLKEEEIGELPQSWNFLVDVNKGELREQNLLHYTNGSPAWEDKWEEKPSDWVFNRELKLMKENVYS
jgi:hypothetical protein